jgi:hypothetical protein
MSYDDWKARNSADEELGNTDPPLEEERCEHGQIAGHCDYCVWETDEVERWKGYLHR